MSAGILLARYGGLSIHARVDAVYVTIEAPGLRPSNIARWPNDWLESPRALQAALQLSHMVELGLAEEFDGFLKISYAHFPALFSAGFTFPLLWGDWSPFALSIHTQGSLTGNGLRFSASFHLGDMKVEVDRAGRYVRRVGHPQTCLLDETTFALLERLELPPNGEDPWVDFAFVKDYASELCAEMDDYLSSNEVIFPAAIRIAKRPGIRGQVEPILDEVPKEVFRRGFQAACRIDRRLTVLLPGGIWGHLIFDDDQLECLHAVKSGSSFAAIEPPPAPIAESAHGRIGTRQARIDSRLRMVPVRLRSQSPIPVMLPMHRGGITIYEQELHSMRLSQLEQLVACLYTARSFRVILTPEGCGLGATLIAIRDSEIWLVRVEWGPAGSDSLDALVRMRAAYRRLAVLPYHLALIVRTHCSSEVRLRTMDLDVEITDGVHLIDDVEARSITYDDVLQAKSRRCRSMLEVMERLQLAIGQPLHGRIRAIDEHKQAKGTGEPASDPERQGRGPVPAGSPAFASHRRVPPKNQD